MDGARNAANRSINGQGQHDLTRRVLTTVQSVVLLGPLFPHLHSPVSLFPCEFLFLLRFRAHALMFVLF